jgi:hypothetical protein
MKTIISHLTAKKLTSDWRMKMDITQLECPIKPMESM